MWCHPAYSLVCPLVYPLHYPVALYEVHVMSSSPSSLVCPLVYPLHYPVALYEVHVMSSSPLSSLPSGLSSPLSSCLVWGPCDVIQPKLSSLSSGLSSPLSSCLVWGPCNVIQLVDLFPSSVQHCASTNVNLLQSFTLAVTSCWTRKRIHFPCTYCLQVYFTSSASTKRRLLSYIGIVIA